MERAGDTHTPARLGIWQTVALAALAALAAAVLVALVVTLGVANHERDRALARQSHSYDVMILARTLAGTIARSEASLGRYVISADRSLGQVYFDEWRRAGAQIEQLDRITDDNSEQHPAIERLRDAYEERGRELSEIALSTTYHKNSQALARFYRASTGPSLATINRELEGITARERRLLQKRGAAASATVERSSRVAGVLGVFGLLLVLGAILLGWLSLRATNERARARADADAASDRAEALAAAVHDATAELRLQEAKLRQVQKMEAVGQLTGGIAHDFNNMLAVVLGGLELARRSNEPATIHRHLDSASEGAQRAAALTRRLLAFSREESLKPEQLCAAALIADMSDLLDRTLGDGITLVAHNGSQGWRVRADRVQLENVVLNLAVNARDAMNGRGTITIMTGTAALAAQAIGDCPPGDYLTIAVRDDGCGMTPEVAERVFEPFFTTKEAGKGTGLGLSQIFGFVRQHGGEIAIETAPGEGTTVTLYLPRDHEVVAALAMPVVEAMPVATAGMEILVVEDDPRVLAATVGALEELGHRTVPCPDPLAAPGLLARHPDIALIVTDVLMPQQTGPEMVAGLADRFAHVAVLFVTGYAGEAHAEQFGDHPLLRKPFTLAALERAVATAAKRGTPMPANRGVPTSADQLAAE